jgi:hypothetical protein
MAKQKSDKGKRPKRPVIDLADFPYLKSTQEMIELYQEAAGDLADSPHDDVAEAGKLMRQVVCIANDAIKLRDRLRALGTFRG